MSELLLEDKPVIRPRELGAVACAGCPFAQLGCPKQGTGDCPPPQVVESKVAAALLDDDSAGQVWASSGGSYFATVTPPPMTKPKEQTLGDVHSIHIERGQVSVVRSGNATRRERIPKLKGASLGEFAATLLLSARRAK